MKAQSLRLQALPDDEFRHWTEERGVSEKILKEFVIAWIPEGTHQVAIPIPDVNGKTAFHLLKRSHTKRDEKPKYKVHPTGSTATLFPLPKLRPETKRIILGEGVPNMLVLASHGIDAICSTAGAATFKEEWLDLFPQGIEVTTCFDVDAAGRKGEEKVLHLFAEKRPDVKLFRIRLPDDLGDGGDIADFFLRCKKQGTDAAAAFNALREPYAPETETEKGDGTGSGSRRESQADTLLSLVTEKNCILFHDQFKEPHVRLRIDDHWETAKTRSKQCRRWLSHLLWESEGKAPTSETLSTVLNVLEAKAVHDGECIVLENRCVWCKGALWYDLCDRRCRAVRITGEGWEIVETPPTLFRRFVHQVEQVPPERGGSLVSLLSFVNLADMEVQGPLLLVYLVSCFIPDIPHPIPNLHGAQGSAKTTLARMLRRLVDPSQLEVLSFPPNTREFVQQLAHHYFAFFDNISEITDSTSDLLCRAVTGEGVSKRELYTDDEDVIYSFRRCIGLNGINPAAKKPDLLDRSILLKLERIPEEQRREERIVLAEFDAARSLILGAIFDALSAAIRLRDSVQLERLPRMADFTRWGCAIAEALGLSQDAFLNAYYANIAEQHHEAIQENPVAAAMRSFMQERTEWEGTMSELYEHLCEVADDEKIDIRAKEWPKAANALSRRLNEAETNLKEIGIVLRSVKGTHGKRVVLIQKTSENIADTATPSLVAEISDVFGGDVSDSLRTDHQDVPPPISPLEEAQTKATNEASGDGGDISPTSNSLKQMGFFQ